jgi:hypothetical protein
VHQTGDPFLLTAKTIMPLYWWFLPFFFASFANESMAGQDISGKDQG